MRHAKLLTGKVSVIKRLHSRRELSYEHKQKKYSTVDMDINWRRVTLLRRKRQPIHMHVSLLVSLINSYLAFSPFFFFIFPFNTFHLSLLCYCVRAKDHCCVICDATRGLLFIWIGYTSPNSSSFILELYNRKG